MEISKILWAMLPAFFLGGSPSRPVAAGRSAGSVVEFTLQSVAYARPRKVWVYQPAGYPGACGTGCALVVAFDGGVYTGDIPLPAILDSLTASHSIAPTIALLIDDASGADRIADLANHQRFVTYVADELVPWLRGKWRVTRDPARTIVTGSSAGGLAAAYLAFNRPELFGNVLSQSGAFWRGNEGTDDPPYEWLTAQYAAAPRKPIRFFLDVGSTESHGAMNGAAPSILDANRHLRDVLREHGYKIDYYEVPNGVHAAESWRLRLPTGLAALALAANSGGVGKQQRFPDER
ncbi:MAG TPA: alpha/beta hydrolase-fold protein [Gemmatimonadaceae bacterium]|jgi:enterochelin esterase family protein